MSNVEVRAKFTVTEIRRHRWSQAGAATVILEPQYDEQLPEDLRFALATPSGRLEMFVDNPAAVERLELGREFYLDFVPVSEPASAD